jgi:hypothetical protein
MFKTLKKARKGLIQFEIGVQSTNDKVLEAIKRPMSFSKIKTIVRRIKSLGTIHQHLDLIAGLPYEDYTSFKQSFNDIITLRPEQFQLGFLKLLNGSGLKKKALTYGIAYQDEAPYEVLYTSHLSFNELLKLHAIEEMVERFYNSERFQISLAYLYTLYDTPFDFYEALATYWEEQGYDKIHHKKEAYYIYLNAFGQTSKDVNAVLLKECIRFDWLCHEKVKEMPSELISLNQSEYKMLTQAWLHDSEWCKILSRELQQMTPRQRFRKMHIEFFRYDLWTSYQNMQYDNAVPLKITQYKVPQAILFDYSKNPADCMPITQEEDQM